MSKIDYLIIGGGIAGVTLAHHLEARGLSFKIYSGGRESKSSSRVAAGLFNPITGRTMVKTWKADLLFPYLLSFYKNVEEKINTTFVDLKTIYRPFFSIEEQNDWVAKSSDPNYKNFIEKVHLKQQYNGKFHDPFGGLALKQCGWLNTSKYLDESLNYFKKKYNNVEYNLFYYKDFLLDKDFVRYKEVEAQKIVFAEGVGLSGNEYFNWLPLAPLKGEILEVNLPFNVYDIFNRGIFVLPLQNDAYRVGSTYSHRDDTWQPTEEGKQQLIEKLEKLITTDFNIVKHTAGIRPATKDRRPFLGRHPGYDNILIFNGLGTKGVSLAPYFANQLIEHVEDQRDLDNEVNIERFFSLYCN